ncbi:hypothetical protein [Cellvibrio polysaccharolyticus]|uniref:hypothetical protein n=1 Tax=Cellvibrio polysaccharolyticus TaxID=2082724 RepID=UPI002E2CEAB5|nr:hypothetical protein [Cellvibrio polysaccharolyticus]
MAGDIITLHVVHVHMFSSLDRRQQRTYRSTVFINFFTRLQISSRHFMPHLDGIGTDNLRTINGHAITRLNVPDADQDIVCRVQEN